MSTETQGAMNTETIARLIEMLGSPQSNLVEEACRTLGNLISESPNNREAIIALGVIPPLVALAKPATEVPILRAVAQILFSICLKINPPVSLLNTEQCLPALASLLAMEDMQIIANTCFALNEIFRGGKTSISLLVSNDGLIARLLELLAYPNQNIVFSSVITLGNIVSNSLLHLVLVVLFGLIPSLTTLLQTHQQPAVMDKVVWIISIVMKDGFHASNIMNSGLIPLIFGLFQGEFRAQMQEEVEVLRIIYYIAKNGLVQQLITLCDAGAISLLCNCLFTINNQERMVLEALGNLLNAANTVGLIDRALFVIDYTGARDKIKLLQTHESGRISTLARRIIDVFQPRIFDLQ